MAAGDENAGMKQPEKRRGRDSISTESRAGTYHNRGQTTHGIKGRFRQNVFLPVLHVLPYSGLCDASVNSCQKVSVKKFTSEEKHF
ncbi:hypothetical protein O5290_22195 [Escherichia coli]|nr:hypothetical protein [Escherichia coli]